MEAENKPGASGIGTLTLLPRSLRASLSSSKGNAGSHGICIDSLAMLQRRSQLGVDDATYLAVSSGRRLAKQMHLASELSVGGWRLGLYAPRVRAEATSRAVGASRLWPLPGDPQHDEELAQLLNEINGGEESKEGVLGNGSAQAEAEEAPWEPPSCDKGEWEQLMVGLSIYGSCDAFDRTERAALRHHMDRAVARISVEAVVAALREQRKPRRTPGAPGPDPPCPHCSDVSRPAMPPHPGLPKPTPLKAHGLRSAPVPHWLSSGMALGMDGEESRPRFRRTRMYLSKSDWLHMRHSHIRHLAPSTHLMDRCCRLAAPVCRVGRRPDAADAAATRRGSDPGPVPARHGGLQRPRHAALPAPLHASRRAAGQRAAGALGPGAAGQVAGGGGAGAFHCGGAGKVQKGCADWGKKASPRGQGRRPGLRGSGMGRALSCQANGLVTGLVACNAKLGPWFPGFTDASKPGFAGCDTHPTLCPCFLPYPVDVRPADWYLPCALVSPPPCSATPPPSTTRACPAAWRPPCPCWRCAAWPGQCSETGACAATCQTSSRPQRLRKPPPVPRPLPMMDSC